MACPGCGLSNLPHHDVCEFCARELLVPSAVEGKRSEWERLTEKLRTEFTAAYEKGLAQRREWRERLRRNRIKHAVGGALTFLFMAGLLHYPVLDVEGAGFLLVVLVELAVGAAAGLWLNRGGGGGYRGLAAYGGGYLAWTVLSLLFGIIVGPFERGVGGGFIWGLFVLPGILVSGSFGYLFGLSLSLQRSLEE